MGSRGSSNLGLNSAMDAAFNASSKELGKAAVKQARRKMWVSVGLMCLTPDGTTGPVNAAPKDFDATLKEAVNETREMLKQYAPEDIVLHMDLEYVDQCNLEFTPQQLKAISELGVTFALTCWESDTE